MAPPNPNKYLAKRKADKFEKKENKKMPNPTLDEKDELVKYMEAHTNFANGRVTGANARQLYNGMAERMAKRVNEVKLDPTKKGGPDRTSKQWWKTWVSLRQAAKAYASENYKRKDTRTGGGADESISSSIADGVLPTNEPEYTCDNPLFDRIMQVIGWHSALGLGVPDELSDENQAKEPVAEPVADESEGKENDSSCSFSEAISSTPAVKRSRICSTLTEIDEDNVSSLQPSASSSKVSCNISKRSKIEEDNVSSLQPSASSSKVSCNIKPNSNSNCSKCEELTRKIDSILEMQQMQNTAINSILDFMGKLNSACIVMASDENESVAAEQPVENANTIIIGEDQYLQNLAFMENNNNTIQMVESFDPDQYLKGV